MAFATADFGVVAVAMNNGGARIPEQLQAEFGEFTRTYQVGRVPYLLIYDFPKTRPMFHAYPPNHPGTSPKKFPFFPDHLGGGWYYLLQDSVSWAEIVSPYSDTFVEVTRKGNEWVVEIHLPIVNGELLKDTCYLFVNYKIGIICNSMGDRPIIFKKGGTSVVYSYPIYIGFDFEKLALTLR